MKKESLSRIDEFLTIVESHIKEIERIINESKRVNLCNESKLRLALERIEHGKLAPVYDQIDSLLGGEIQEILLKVVVTNILKRASKGTQLIEAEVEGDIRKACQDVHKWASNIINRSHYNTKQIDDMIEILDEECRRWSLEDRGAMVDAVRAQLHPYKIEIIRKR